MDFAKLEEVLEEDGIVFLTYGGLLSQTLIVGMTEALERESEANDINTRVSNNLFTIFIELSQNMMNYARSQKESDTAYDSKGLIVVGLERQKNTYYILSRNIVTVADKNKIAPMLEKIEPMDKEQLKQYYREMRKSGSGKHAKGAGIGFIEIARRCDRLEHSFEPMDEERYFFSIHTSIQNR